MSSIELGAVAQAPACCITLCLEQMPYSSACKRRQDSLQVPQSGIEFELKNQEGSGSGVWDVRLCVCGTSE